MRIIKKILVGLLLVVVVAGIIVWWMARPDVAEYSLEDTSGTDPVLAEAESETIPTVGIAEPIGWGEDGTPEAADGLVVNRFAEGLEHPRVLHTLPNGDVLVTLTNRPQGEGGDSGGIGSWIRDTVAGWLFSRAGAAVPTPNQLVLLRDANEDGVAEQQFVIREEDLDSPSGIAWQDGDLYIANHDEILRFDYELGTDRVTGEAEQIAMLPAAGNHWMRNLLLSEDGESLFVAVGSASNIAENGLDIEEGRAAIHEIPLGDGAARVYGSGLRNANGMDWNPWTGDLWAAVNERDMLGSDLVPDYMTDVPIGAHYGWPWFYYGDRVDGRVEGQPAINPDYVRTPEYALGAHSAPLGMLFTRPQSRLGFGQGAFVARHGSWNRSPPAGYDVVFVSFDARGNPTGKPRQVLRSFLVDDERTYGRPTWLAWDRTGALLVSDDTGNIIWRVSSPNAEEAGAVERNTGAPLPPRRQLRGDPSRAFEEGAVSMEDIL